MVIKLLTLCFHAFFVLGSALLALLPVLEVSGTWSGAIDMRTTDGASNRVAIYADFRQSGHEVTGTFGPTPTEQFRIERAIVTGTTFTFQVAAPTRMAMLKLAWSAAGRLDGEVVTEDGRAYGRVTLIRDDAQPGRGPQVSRVEARASCKR